MARASALYSMMVALPLVANLAPPPGSEPGECASAPEFELLDFWVGTWDVFVDGRQIGKNRIREILGGCAVTEDWTDARGGEGHSLFYYHPAEEAWKQVWVTRRPLERGGLKEKTFLGRTPDGGIRFQGEVFVEGGQSYLDRTTLTPRGPDEVGQLIEISVDGGEGWQTVFDGEYRRSR